MPKWWWSLWVCLALHAADVTIYTLNLDANTTKITAQPRVGVDYKNFHAEATKAIYDEKEKIVYLYGNIVVLNNNQYSYAGDYAFLDLKTDKIYAQPFYFGDNSSMLWIAGKNITSYKKKVYLKSAYLSSCTLGCSDWKIGFSSAILDKKKHWIDIYNPVFYIRNFPLIYAPYIGFSTQKKRKTGLLRPVFGLSKDEGTLYIQPIFIAPKSWWDLEFDPQIRTKRGAGLYGTFRFVHPYQRGSLTTGYFKEKRDFFHKKDLRNDKHYGIDLFYENSRLFAKNEEQDGLYVDIKSYNDVEYYHLKEDEDIFSVSPLITSRLNYFFSNDKNYYGIYAKYFKDNNKIDNSDTLQILPTLHYHRYLDHFLGMRSLYSSLDVTMDNYYRQKGLRAQNFNFYLPITFYHSFFDESVGVSISENLYANYASYSDGHSSHLYRNAHRLALYSDLLKPYSSFIHTLHLSAALNIPSFEKEGGKRADFIDVGQESKNLDLSLKHYFYTKDGQEVLYHRMSQLIFYDKKDKFSDLENEIGLRWKNFSVTTDTFFSYSLHTFSAVASSLHYQDEKYAFNLSHYFRRKREKNSNFLRFGAKRFLSKKYDLFATMDYDIANSFTKSWSIGLNARKKCWGYSISYRKELTPTLTATGSSFYENHIVYLRIELYPIGGITKSFEKHSERNL